MYWWDTFAIPADAHLLNGYALNGYASHGYVLVGYVLNEYVLVGYVLMGYLEDRVGYYLLIRHGGHRYVCYVALIFLVTYTCGNYNCCKCALQW